MTKTAKLLGLGLSVLCASQAAFAQDLKIKPKLHASAHDTLDASMARLAVKAAFQPSAQPTQQELLSVLVLVSLREQRRSGT
jgi:hypothetical protein